MYGSVKDDLATTLEGDPGRGALQERARADLAAVGARDDAQGRGAELLRQQLPRPGQRAVRRRRGQGTPSTRGASGWRRCASSAGRRRCTPTSRDRISDFLGMESTILYSSCFDANGGVFEVLFGAEDAIVSDELNHASIIDGVRLSKARRFRYRNADMADLRAQLTAANDGGARRIVVVTDGVFSMDGSYAPLDEICDLAEEFGAMVFVDDSHAVGFVGAGGRGTPELLRGDGPGRHPHRHARQGPRRGVRRLRQQPPRGRRAAAPALAALPVLQLRRAGRGGRVDGRARARRGLLGQAGGAAAQHRAVHPPDDRGRVSSCCPGRTRSGP